MDCRNRREIQLQIGETKRVDGKFGFSGNMTMRASFAMCMMMCKPGCACKRTPM
ncbi:MAG: hypothetical protein LBK04_00375 [Clostridiales Family XIII bacterium]|nr:hypothetical protein [Clostridiales Family XIII bacterium]